MWWYSSAVSLAIVTSDRVILSRMRLVNVEKYYY